MPQLIRRYERTGLCAGRGKASPSSSSRPQTFVDEVSATTWDRTCGMVRTGSMKPSAGGTSSTKKAVSIPAEASWGLAFPGLDTDGSHSRVGCVDLSSIYRRYRGRGRPPFLTHSEPRSRLRVVTGTSPADCCGIPHGVSTFFNEGPITAASTRGFPFKVACPSQSHRSGQTA